MKKEEETENKEDIKKNFKKACQKGEKEGKKVKFVFSLFEWEIVSMPTNRNKRENQRRKKLNCIRVIHIFNKRNECITHSHISDEQPSM